MRQWLSNKLPFLCFLSPVLFFFFLRFYLFIHKRHREGGRNKGRGKRSRLRAGSPMWDLIPGLRDHALSQRQMLNHWATQASHDFIFFLFFLKIYLFIYLFMRERERGRDTGRGRSRLHAKSSMQDSIQGLQDLALGQRQALNRWATQGCPDLANF